ncbi:MAG: carboxy terminal-processing peptidase [Chitinophagaceae bacterium]|nr:carboxy terminal-processing peptidase [Chitinophagaceae bacterium]
MPDITLPDLYGDDEYKEKNNKSALQPDKNKSSVYKALPVLPIANLTAKSQLRVKANAQFNLLNNFINWLKQYNNSRTISLQWVTYANQFNEAIKMYKQIKDDEKRYPIKKFCYQ